MAARHMSTAGPYAYGERIERAVYHHAARTPEAVALRQDDRTLTYAGLRAAAGRVAAGLRGRGVGPGHHVPVRVERSPELVVALLGVLEAGASYIAMDPDWPRERADDVLARAGAPLVLTEGLLTELPTDENVPPVGTGADAACVFFTSGSTGRPKGVISPHRGTIRTLVNCPTLPLDATSVLMQSAPLPWDGMSLELWAPLLNGGRCVLVGRGARTLDAATLRAAIERDVNTLWLTSSLFNVLAEEDSGLFAGVRLLMVGGERVSVPHARAVLRRFPGLRMVNGYGPVESTIFTTTHVIRPADIADDSTEIPIGRPVPRTGVLLIDEHGRPGEEGEIAVSGDGLALGYLADPEETARRFLDIDGVRHYHTGDLAVRDAEGNLRYRGRADRQFKIRGLRIEPGEVEGVLEAHPRVATACVLRVETTPERPEVACAYTTSDGEPVDPAELRAFAARRLLSGMVPAVLLHIPRMPLGATGKTDQAAVRELLAERAGARAPLWERDLPGDLDLIEAGLTSLDAVRLAARLSRRTARRITVRDVYRLRTTERILAAGREPDTAQASFGEGAERAPMSHAQRRFWVAEQLSPGEADNLIVLAYALDGPLDTARLARALDDVTSRHPILRTVYPWEAEHPVARVLDKGDLALETVPASDGHETAGPREVAERITADWWDTPSWLDDERPLRARLCRLGPGRHLLCLRFHHIAFDGWSEGVFAGDLRAAYTGRPRETPPLAYAAYTEWERAGLARWTETDLPYWRRVLASAPPPFLPAPAGQGEARRLERVLRAGPGTVAALAQNSGRYGGPPVAGLLAVTGLALARTFGVDDVCLGTVTSGRMVPELENMVGYTVNPLAVPLTGVPDRTPPDLLRASAEGVLDALEHSRTPFDALATALRPGRERHPWFQAWAVLQNPPPHGPLGDGVTLTPLRVRPPRTSMELLLEAVPQPDGSWDLVVGWREDGIDGTAAAWLADELERALHKCSK
ncbi:AMP-binding protein [Spongiactinospora sp. TRM90649]|uniref:AMP-binding protein n=1 Tax=Spongiactinospora sp. TRM90649 TaxID=3031114 RepID=UPI0023F81FEC|nr:AMP-binding protein [Spongiactinospora sp. TRM90649]MDF5757679.1 AMP-binding protein [Spongiactinospora sp. TRM90649]